MACPVGPSLPLISSSSTCHILWSHMASKKTQIDNPLVGTSEVDPTLDSNFDIPCTGSMTRGRIKALAEVYAQTTPIPQSSSVFNTSEIEKSQTASSTQGASKDVASL